MQTDNIIKFCPFCGSKVIPNAKFCINCGQDLTILNMNNTEEEPENTIQDEKTIDILSQNKSETDLNDMDSETIIEENDEINDNPQDAENDSKPTAEQPKIKKSFSILNQNSKNKKEDNTFDLVRPNPAHNLKQESQPVKEDKENYPEKTEDTIEENYNTNGLPCPVCEKNMHFTETSGFFSKAHYHQCPDCLLKFKENGNLLVLEEEPQSTRMSSKLHLKRYTLEQWKEILNGAHTPEFNEEFSGWTFDSAPPFSCPVCNHELARYKSSGFGSKYYLICSGCGMTLEERNNNKYQLHDCKENYSPLWKYEKNLLTLYDMQKIIESEDTEETKKFREKMVKEAELKIEQHMLKLKQQQEDLELFNNRLVSGNPLLPVPSDNTIVLKKNEVPVYKLYNVTLSEPRAVRTSSGGYGGTSVRIAKGVTLHSGRTASKSESHDEIKVIDTGELLITNQRVIFLGSNRTTNIDLKKIISITSGASMIQIQRSNKQKPEYFNNIYATEDFQVDGRQYSVTMDGEMVKKLIMGLI